MFSIETIASLSEEACRKARAKGLKPEVFNDYEDFIDGFTSRVPNIGNYRPKGWELVKELFVDKSGLGRSDEPALTQAQFFKTAYIHGHGYALIEEGQFQCYIGVFKRI